MQIGRERESAAEREVRLLLRTSANREREGERGRERGQITTENKCK